jgi:hypothetical protein
MVADATQVVEVAYFQQPDPDHQITTAINGCLQSAVCTRLVAKVAFILLILYSSLRAIQISIQC